MKWLGNAMLASLVGGILAVRLFEYLSGGAQSTVANAAKASIFVTTWTAITTGSGMRDFSKRVRQLRGWLNTRR